MINRVCLSMTSAKLALIVSLLFLLSACNHFETNDSSNAEATEPSAEESSVMPAKLPKACKQPVKVNDIWQLEPLLIESGDIKESMSQAEKESIIHQYIQSKNRQYKVCISSKGQ